VFKTAPKKKKTRHIYLKRSIKLNDYLIVSSQLVFAGSADTQLYLVSSKHQNKNFLISFSGFLNTTADSVENFRCSEINIHTGANVKDIIGTLMERSKDNKVTEHHSFRRFPLTPQLKQLVVEWIFSADLLMSMD
jgi:hypothetical protein